MAKNTAEPAAPEAAIPDITAQIEVRLHGRTRVEAQYEILLAGKRIAYVGGTAPYRISPLPADLKEFRLPLLSAPEWKAIAELVRPRVAAAEKAATEIDGLSIEEFLAGGPTE